MKPLKRQVVSSCRFCPFCSNLNYCWHLQKTFSEEEWQHNSKKLPENCPLLKFDIKVEADIPI